MPWVASNLTLLQRVQLTLAARQRTIPLKEDGLMNGDWIQNLADTTTIADSPDLPDRGERYIAVVDPYWNSLKADIKSHVDQFNRQHAVGRRAVLVEDVGPLLLLSGDGFGVKIKLEIERERLLVSYSEFPWRRGKPRMLVTLHLDMRLDCLVIVDCRGCIVDDPARFVLERFFRSLTVSPRVRRLGAPRW